MDVSFKHLPNCVEHSLLKLCIFFPANEVFARRFFSGTTSLSEIALCHCSPVVCVFMLVVEKGHWPEGWLETWSLLLLHLFVWGQFLDYVEKQS